MAAIQRIAGVALIVIGVAVGVHTVVVPLYHVSTEADPNSPFWAVLDWFMALAVVLGVVFAGLRKKAAGDVGDGAPITREYLVANVQLYGFLFVGILFLWNWFNFLSPGFTAIGADTVTLVWAFVDVALSLLSVTLGLHLARNGGRRP